MRTTSLEAREKIEPALGSIRRKVYEFFINRGMQGATDQEAERYLHIDGNTIRPVRGWLVKEGFLTDTGETRKNDKGNNCIVWRYTESGMML